MSLLLTDDLQIEHDGQESNLLAKRRRKASSGRALYRATSDYQIVNQNIETELEEADYQLSQRHGGTTSLPELNSLTVNVWINTNSGVWHGQNQRWHQNTKDGFLCSVTEARKSGYRASANGQ